MLPTPFVSPPILPGLAANFASPPPIGSTTPNTITGTTITATGNINLQTSGAAVTWRNGGIVLVDEGANILAQQNGANGQTYRLYNSNDGAGNTERLTFTWISNVAFIYSEQAGSGTSREVRIGTTGANQLSFFTNNAIRFVVNSSGHLVTNTDNANDIGASGATRPRNVYVAGSVIPDKAVSLLSTGGAAIVGEATLGAGGTVTVNTTAATATAKVFCQRKTNGGTIGFATTYTINAGTSFTLTSDNALDRSVYEWMIIEAR